MPSSGYQTFTFTAGEQPTTAKWSLIPSNDASFNNGNGFNDSILVARHFATNAVPAAGIATSAITLGYAQITTQFATTSGTDVQVTGLTSTVTIPAGSRYIEIVAYTYNIFTTTGGTQYLSIYDGAVGGTRLQVAQYDPTATSKGVPVYMSVVVTPAAGSKTYNVGLSTSSGGQNATIAATATGPAFILVRAI